MAVDWTLALIQNGAEISDLAPSATTLRWERRRGAQVKSMALPHDADGAAELHAARVQGRVALACYRHDSLHEAQGDNPDPRFCGWLAPIQDELQGDDPTVSALQWFDPLGIPFDTSTTSEEFTGQQSGAIVQALVEAENAEAPSGLIMGTVATTPARDRTYTFKTLSSAIYELADLGDFETSIRYLDPTTNAGALAELSIAAAGSTDRSASVRLEAGDGTLGNVVQVSRAVKPPVNKISATVHHAITGVLVISTVVDLMSIARWGKWESVQAVDGLNDADLTEKAHALLIPDPVESCVFTPDPETGPQPWVDFWIPDTLGFLADIDELNIDTAMPVIAVEIDLDENLQESGMRFEYGSPRRDLPSLIGQLAERVYILEHPES